MILDKLLDTLEEKSKKGGPLERFAPLIEAQETLSRAWYLIPYYDHEIFLSMKDVEKALANQIN